VTAGEWLIAEGWQVRDKGARAAIQGDDPRVFIRPGLPSISAVAAPLVILRLLNVRAPPSRELVFRGDGNVSRRNPN
jgi:hypothetical protein